MAAPGTLGILLAGGRGERLGLGVPKALAVLGGRTLVERALETLRACCERVVVVAPRTIELPVPAELRRCDADPGEGPLAGLLTGAGDGEFERALVLGVDFPLVRPAALARLAERLGGAHVVLPVPTGVPQPLVAWYAASAVAPLAAAFARGERSIRRALDPLERVLVSADELAALPGGADAFLNVNTPDDLARAERSLAAHGGVR